MSSLSPEQVYALSVEKYDEAVEKLRTVTIQWMSSHNIEDENKEASKAAKLYSKLSRENEKVQALQKDYQERNDEMRSMLQLEFAALKERDITPDKSALKQAISENQDQLRESEKKEEELKSQRRKFDSHRLNRKLQKRIADLHFDLSSTDSQIKGYFQMPNGDLKTFDFNLGEDSLCYISNFMWDSL